jgi:hypothetical protein
MKKTLVHFVMGYTSHILDKIYTMGFKKATVFIRDQGFFNKTLSGWLVQIGTS